MTPLPPPPPKKNPESQELFGGPSFYLVFEENLSTTKFRKQNFSRYC